MIGGGLLVASSAILLGYYGVVRRRQMSEEAAGVRPRGAGGASGAGTRTSASKRVKGKKTRLPTQDPDEMGAAREGAKVSPPHAPQCMQIPPASPALNVGT